MTRIGIFSGKRATGPAGAAGSAPCRVQPAGYALFFDYYSSFHGPCIFLEDLFIRQDFRGKGVGQALLSRVAAIAQNEAPFGLILQVYDWNSPAVELYKKLGATFWNDLKTLCFKDETLLRLAAAATEA